VDIIKKNHEDVKVFEVKESDGTHIGLLYVDYFPRESKRGGAWMSAFRKQSKRGGGHITPVIVNCGNFSKPTGDKPALLSWDEVNTLFHEFVHALHGLSGVILILIVWNLGRKGHYTSERHWAVEATASYWHYVDLVWVFFYPALYLMGTAV